MPTDRKKNPPHPIPALLTGSEMPAKLRISQRQFAYLLTKPDALPPAVHIGKRKFWAVTDVANWIAAGGTAQRANGGAQ